MPKYRIVSEIDPGSDHREPRGERLRLDEARLVTIVEEHSLLDAALCWEPGREDPESHAERRIVSIEEVHPGFEYTGEQISAALTDPGRNPHQGDQPLIDPEDFPDDEPLYASGDFIWTVHQVAEALRDCGLVPGLHISLLQNESGCVDYSMVEVRDDARGIYLARGAELKRLIDDRSATGWNAVLSIAKALIDLSNDLH